MNSIEEVYNSLKKYDSEDKLTLTDEKIEFKINDTDKIIAFEDVVSIESNNTQITHFHPNDYNEIYQYLLDIIENRRTIPIENHTFLLRIIINIVIFIGIVILIFIFINK